MSEPSSRSLERARKLIVSYLIDIGVQQDECTSHEDRLAEEIAFALDAARAQERERCARICIDHIVPQRQPDLMQLRRALAENIRKSEDRTTILDR